MVDLYPSTRPLREIDMNVRTLCLAILGCGDSTGYEIRKLVSDGHYSHFGDASFGSIYPALNRMETEGLVVSREEQQDGKPNRKVFSITEPGREAFLDALSQPAQKDIFKSEFLLLAMCADLMRPQDVSRAIDMQIDYLKAELDIIETAVREVSYQGADWVGNYGRTCLTTSLNYINENRAELEAIAGTALAPNSPLLAAE